MTTPRTTIRKPRGEAVGDELTCDEGVPEPIVRKGTKRRSWKLGRSTVRLAYVCKFAKQAELDAQGEHLKASFNGAFDQPTGISPDQVSKASDAFKVVLRSLSAKFWRLFSRRGRFPTFRCWLARTVPEPMRILNPLITASSSINPSLRYHPSASLLEPPLFFSRYRDCCFVVASHQAVHSVPTGPRSFDSYDMNTRGQSSQPYPAVTSPSMYMPRRRW